VEVIQNSILIILPCWKRKNWQSDRER